MLKLELVFYSNNPLCLNFHKNLISTQFYFSVVNMTSASVAVLPSVSSYVNYISWAGD